MLFEATWKICYLPPCVFRIEFEGQTIQHVFLMEGPVAHMLQEYSAQPWFALREYLAPFLSIDSQGKHSIEGKALNFIDACRRPGMAPAEIAKAADVLRPAMTEKADWER